MADVVEITETLNLEPAMALAGLLDVTMPEEADGLPPLWHCVYLLSRPPQRDLGPDGHPRVGGIPAPPGPGFRRMFAGGGVRTLAPLRWGRPATRRTTVLDTELKNGRSGPMTFVRVGTEIVQDGRAAVSEWQNIVYRAPAGGGQMTPSQSSSGIVPVAEKGGDDGEERSQLRRVRSVAVDPTFLFRFSALTYNAHRIHYDRDYARDVEGYTGLVVHGPLQALLMMEAARSDGPGEHWKGPSRFEYRLVAPLTDDQEMHCRLGHGRDHTNTEIVDGAGRKTAHGRFTLGG